MRLRHSPIFAAFLVCASVVHAVRPAPAEAPVQAEAPVKTDAAKTDLVPVYELKNRSVFPKAEEVTRAPFWPIGWVQRSKAGPAPAPQVQAAPKVPLSDKSFRVTSILIGSGTTPSLAVINGRAYSEGEFVRKPPGVAAARVRVQRITDGAVILQNADQTLVAPLPRPELNNKRPEELLLDPDR